MKNTKYQKKIAQYAFVLVCIWTVLVAILIIYQLFTLHKITLEMAVNEARANFKKDQAFRFWGAYHGGVYAPVTDKYPPNPNLAHIKERDIQTPSGKKLTLINPAYMMRQMNEMFAEVYGQAGHITSLKLLRPENAPDAWEKKALLSFEEGVKEVMEFVDIDELPYLRLMRPLFIQQGCLKCHWQEGYKIGDVRGGITVSLKMAPFFGRERRQSVIYLISYSIILALGIIGIISGAKRLKLRIRERDEAYEELKEYQIHLEELVKKRTVELEEANKELYLHVKEVERVNKELRNFSHIVSHDLKSPMTSIMGMAELLSLKYSDNIDDTGKNMLNRIVYNTQLMNDLINGLLELSRIGRLDDAKEELSLNDQIQRILQENHHRIEKIGAKISVAKNLPVVYYPKVMLYQLFSNLIGNALKFSREGIPPEIKVGCEEAESEYIIFVSDNGIGIREQDFDKIFDMFSRLDKSKVEGSGIGLAIVKKIVFENEGRIWVKSKEGEGATFHVTIPKKRS